MFEFTVSVLLALAGVVELLVGRLFEVEGEQLASNSTNAIDAKYLNFMAWFFQNK